MNPLPWPAETHLQAAEGWLELGNSHEANEGLERISADGKHKIDAHPQR